MDLVKIGTLNVSSLKGGGGESSGTSQLYGDSLTQERKSNKGKNIC